MKHKKLNNKVAIILGSNNDLKHAKPCIEILKQLKENTVSCKNVFFRVFGLSLATINAIFSFILFYIFLRLFKNYEDNR